MSRAADLLGTVLRTQYRLEAVVTENFESIVFAGHAVDGAPVTIRMARPLRGLSDEELAEACDAFAIEAEQLAQLGRASPNVEQLLASGEMDSPDRERLAYCVFSRTDGTSLAQVLRGRGAQSLSRTITALEPVAKALMAAHDQNAFHGDVRPENMILVEAAQRPMVKLIRFSLATRLGNGPRTFAPEYGAPEQFKRTYGDNSVGPATDVYGLALTIVELVTGRPPFDGTHPTELFKQTADISRRPTARARGGAVSEAVDAVLAKALAVNPKLRFATVREMWEALLVAAAPELANADSTRELPADGPAVPGAPPSTPSVQITAAPGAPRAPTHARAPDIVPLDGGGPPNGRPMFTRNVALGSAAGLALAAVAGLLLLAVVPRRSRTGHERPPSSASTIHAGVPQVSSAAGSVAVVATAHASASASTAASTGVPAPPASSSDEPEGMIRVDAASFTMGNDREGKGDRPAHKVTLTRAFYIDRTEVTAEAYGACVEAGACTPRAIHVKKSVQGAWGCNTEKDRGNHPANCVDRSQAAAYCAFAKKRLPTEAEWELAARGTDEREFPWGNTMPTSCALAVLSGMAGGCGERKGTLAVGTTKDGASPSGALDMGGNVWEWVADDYAPYPADPVKDPRVTLEGERARGILRGGSWDYAAASAKTTFRLPFAADAGNASIGVRCARNAD